MTTPATVNVREPQYSEEKLHLNLRDVILFTVVGSRLNVFAAIFCLFRFSYMRIPYSLSSLIKETVYKVLFLIFLNVGLLLLMWRVLSEWSRKDFLVLFLLCHFKICCFN